MKNFFLKKLPTMVAAVIFSFVIGTAFAALNHVNFGSPITSAAWNEMVDEINLKISSFTEADPKVGALGTSFVPKWNGSALTNSSMYESANTELVVKGNTTPSHFGLNVTDNAGTSNLLVRNDGKVGIGTTTPQTTLDVNGAIRTGRYTTASMPTCNANLLGSFAFDTTQNRHYSCTSTGWKPLDSDFDKDGLTDAVDVNDNDVTGGNGLANLVAGNIKSGVVVNGVSGNYTSNNGAWTWWNLSGGSCFSTCSSLGGVKTAQYYGGPICVRAGSPYWIMGYDVNGVCATPGGASGTTQQCLCNQ